MIKLEYFTTTGINQLSFPDPLRSIVIVGENGSGKSTLLRSLVPVIEGKAVIIAAQKDLTIMQGRLRASDEGQLIQEAKRFSSNRALGSVTSIPNNNNLIQSDIDGMLEVLVRQYRNSVVETYDRAKRAGKMNMELNVHRDLDLAISTWNEVFISRELRFQDGKIMAFPAQATSPYDIGDLSDGEKEAFYILMKIALANESDTIVIDEPETFLNTALLSEIFDRCEALKPNNKFVYFSHDLEFVTTRQDCAILWIKSYTHPNSWVLQEINATEKLPEDLLIKIIGVKKKKILFIEGEVGSDNLLYSRIYKDFKIIPVGSCDNVINYTKSLRQNNESYGKEYFGLIDSDLRSIQELKELESNKIFHIPFAIYENIYMSEPLVKFVYEYLGKPNFLKDYALLTAQIRKQAASESYKRSFTKYQMTQYFNQNIESLSEGKLKFKPDLQSYADESQELSSQDINTILTRYNQKDLLRSCVTTTSPGYRWGAWMSHVIQIFNTKEAVNLRKIFMEFMPDIK